MKLLMRLLLLSAVLWSAESAKILAVLPFPSVSHFILSFPLVRELANRGHQVTCINPYPQKTPIKNYKDVSVENIVELVDGYRKKLFSLEGDVQNMMMAVTMMEETTRLTYETPSVQQLLNSDETFDLVLMEYFLNEAHVGFGHRFKSPIVMYSPLPSPFSSHLFANPVPSSYVPGPTGAFSKHMNFWERLENFISVNIIAVVRELFVMPKQREIFKKYIKTELQLDDILYNVSLLLVNSHVSVHDAIPHVPNIIEIGGHHINSSKKLPADLQKFMDDAKEGVILFSMGSNLKGADLKPEVCKMFLDVFSRIKQKVLWKFEEELEGLPQNVKTMKWLPQQDILAHPNIRAFVTHGGLLSTIETVYYGVPIVGIPVYGDQKGNIAAAVANGYALGVPLSELTSERFLFALNEILNNPKYRENAKWRSKIMKDRPLSPLDTGVYWIEYVIRHQGAPQLRSAGMNLRWYQREMLDIIILLTLITIVLFVIFYVIIRWLLGLCISKKIVSKAKKNK